MSGRVSIPVCTESLKCQRRGRGDTSDNMHAVHSRYSAQTTEAETRYNDVTVVTSPIQGETTSATFSLRYSWIANAQKHKLQGKLPRLSRTQNYDLERFGGLF